MGLVAPEVAVLPPVVVEVGLLGRRGRHGAPYTRHGHPQQHHLERKKLEMVVGLKCWS